MMIDRGGCVGIGRTIIGDVEVEIGIGLCKAESRAR